MTPLQRSLLEAFNRLPRFWYTVDTRAEHDALYWLVTARCVEVRVKRGTVNYRITRKGQRALKEAVTPPSF